MSLQTTCLIVNRTNLGTALQNNEEGLTVFAPSNQAFEKAFKPGDLENLSPEALADLVARHVIFGRVTAETLTNDKVTQRPICNNNVQILTIL